MAIPLQTSMPEVYTVAGDSAEIFGDIYRADVNMAVWQRAVSPALSAECDALLKEGRFRGCSLSLPTSQLSTLSEAEPVLTAYPALSSDIQLLADMFSLLFELDAVGLRLTPLSGKMCPKFHTDNVACRLVTSYSGPGTQWLPHHCVDRSKLGAGSRGLSDADSGLYPAASDINTLQTHHVALLKGENWEGNEGAGLVHRSPAVAPGQQRLLLTLDFL